MYNTMQIMRKLHNNEKDYWNSAIQNRNTAPERKIIGTKNS